MRPSFFCLLVSIGLGLATVGCSSSDPKPELVPVKGKVTVDGLPGADLDVVFEPQAKGSAKGDNRTGNGSSARTDTQGNYELIYQGVGGGKGAAVGTHKVRITSAAGGGPAGGETGAKPTVQIPANWNTETNVTREVKKGGPVEENFDIKTK